MEFVINFQPVGRRLLCSQPLTIFEAAHQAGIQLKSLCGGKGECGKCRVKVKGDAISPLTEAEVQKLSAEEIADGYRQACQATVSGMLQVYVPASSLTEAQKLQITGEDVSIVPAPAARKAFVRLVPPSLDDVRADLKRVTDGLRAQGDGVPVWASLPALNALSQALRQADWAVTLTLERDEIIAVEPGDTRGQLLGVAVDLGTTKIAVYLVDLRTGKTLGAQGVMNPQIAHGEDIISRIQIAASDRAKAELLQAEVIRALNETAATLLAAQEAAPETIVAISLVGNTAMHHLFLGLPVKPLALSPFIPVTTEPIVLKARELGLQAAPAASVYLLPPVAGFVGSDHVAALLASLPPEGDSTVLLMDLGTNTEIALRARGRITSCSCACGPAFEGMHIKHGMRAAPGAVERVRIDRETLQVHTATIDDHSPVGICGSGILDAIAEMVKAGIVNSGGHIRPGLSGVRDDDEEGPSFLIAEWQDGEQSRAVTVTQQDIVEIQLAKGATRTGIEVLLEEAGLGPNDLDQIIIAGAFGTYLDPLSAMRIGLLPEVPLERIEQVGNAAGVGAKLALASREQWLRGVALAKKVNYVELTVHPSFRKLFAKAVRFAPMRQRAPKAFAGTYA